MKFTKMHGLGNDFIVIDNTDNTIQLTTTQIQHLAHRNFGIGFDQLLLVEENTTGDADFDYIIYNADGMQIEQCGNGARCFAKYVYDFGLTKNTTITAKTVNTILKMTIGETKGNITQVRVNMGSATFNPTNITHTKLSGNTTNINGYNVGIVDMSNPHAIYCTDSLATKDIVHIGTTIQNSSLWTNGVNVNIVEVHNPTKISLETYERGAGHTLACGTGACATVAFLHHIHQLDDAVMVQMRGGNAHINITDNKIILTGPAEFVFNGEIV